MSKTDCGKHDEKKGLRLIIIGAVVIIVAIGFAVLLVWLILRPSKPQFLLQDYTLYSLNLTQPNYLTSTMQVTVSTRNPNGRIGIYYQKLDVFATYRDQQLTLATELPMNYLGHKETAIWSPYLFGNSVPVSPYLAQALGQDLNAGWLLFYIRVSGNLKWKVGTWMSGHYGVSANCPAYLSFGHHVPPDNSFNGSDGFTGGFGIKYQFVQECTVELY